MSRDDAPGDEIRPTLVVVGHGMVGHRFCETFSQLGGLERFKVVVFGDEPFPAYDRVHLGELFEASQHSLSLTDCAWYETRGIELALGQTVSALDLRARCVHTRSGRRQRYDLLVLATGARARVPEVQGLPAEAALTYRTMADVERIRRACGDARRVAILGGGLLGLECAYAWNRKGHGVRVLEASKSLLPRQLDSDSAAVLEGVLRDQGIVVNTGFHLLRVESSKAGYTLYGESREPLRCDALILAAGVEPEDRLARDAGLACAPRGGVAVSDTLATSDAAVFAIGDCAAHRGVSAGLVAPGYDMAEVLAARLCGQDQRTFGGAERACRLKIAGLEVATLGRYDLEAQAHRYRDGHVARSLVVHNGRLVGATVVGAWAELGDLSRLIAEQAPVSERTLRRFLKDGNLTRAKAALPVAAWPAESLVCQCARVSRRQLTCALSAGACDLASLQAATRAGTVCGSCTPLLGQLLGAPAAAPPARFMRLTVWASALASLAFLTMLLAPSVGAAGSVQETYHLVERLWRSSLFRQLTGFGVLSAFTLGLLLSARKRLRWFRWGEFSSYRALHAWLGVLALLGLFVHTGFRLGSHLNLMLMLVFLGASLLGALGGFASYAETRGSCHAPRLRGVLARYHVWLLWPLPTLLFFHVLAAYYF